MPTGLKEFTTDFQARLCTRLSPDFVDNPVRLGEIREHIFTSHLLKCRVGKAVVYFTCLRAKLERMLATPFSLGKTLGDQQLICIARLIDDSPLLSVFHFPYL